MEEIHEVALAYYATATENCKEQIRNFFFSMDTDGDGSISVKEFQRYMEKTYPQFNQEKLFKQLDQDGDGVLDFEEVIVFYYMVTVRNRACDGIGCGEFLNRVYFTCALCFLDKNENQSYDLCIKCYKNKRYNHRADHQLFLDNYVMLTLAHEESKKKEFENALAITSHQHTNSRSINAPQGYSPQQVQYNPYNQHYMQYYATQGAQYVNYATPHVVYVQNHHANHNMIRLGTVFNTINEGCSVTTAIAQLAAMAFCTIM